MLRVLAGTVAIFYTIIHSFFLSHLSCILYFFNCIKASLLYINGRTHEITSIWNVACRKQPNYGKELN